MLFASPTLAQQQSLAGPHAKIELISEETSYRPSHTLSVGFLFHLDAGWHIYWQNPGDSGEPPKLDWHLPPGFRAGAIQWPVPIRFGSKEVMDYGYENQVLLIVPVQVPANAPPAANLSATVKYLICREICIPAKADASLQLSASKAASPQYSASRDLFQKTRAQLPQNPPAAFYIAAYEDSTTLTISTDNINPGELLSFFPLDESVIENSAPQAFRQEEKGTRLTLQKSNLLRKPISRLNGVLVLSSGRAYIISVPVYAAPPHNIWHPGF